MNTDQAIAAEVSQYLQSQPLAQADFAAQYGPELEAIQREVADQMPEDEPQARGLGDAAVRFIKWIWPQVGLLVKQQICSDANYATLSSITTDQLAARIDDLLTPLVAAVTDALPSALNRRISLSMLRTLIANIIAHELQQAGKNGWAAYCGLLASR